MDKDYARSQLTTAHRRLRQSRGAEGVRPEADEGAGELDTDTESSSRDWRQLGGSTVRLICGAEGEG